AGGGTRRCRWALPAAVAQSEPRRPWGSAVAGLPVPERGGGPAQRLRGLPRAPRSAAVLGDRSAERRAARTGLRRSWALQRPAHVGADAPARDGEPPRLCPRARRLASRPALLWSLRRGAARRGG